MGHSRGGHCEGRQEFTKLNFHRQIKEFVVMKDKKKKKEETAIVAGSVARVTEIIASSSVSFEDAVKVGVDRACKTLKNVTSAWVQDQKVDVVDGEISCFRVILKVTFVLND